MQANSRPKVSLCTTISIAGLLKVQGVGQWLEAANRLRQKQARITYLPMAEAVLKTAKLAVSEHFENALLVAVLQLLLLNLLIGRVARKHTSPPAGSNVISSRLLPGVASKMSIRMLQV